MECLKLLLAAALCCLSQQRASSIDVTSTPAAGSSATSTPGASNSATPTSDAGNVTVTAVLHSLNTSLSSNNSSTCADNHFLVGEVCLQCGCAKKKDCAPKTGECPIKRCKKGRYDLSAACVYGIVSIRNEKANPGQATNASCVVRTADAVKDPPEVTFSTGSSEVQYKPVETTVLDISTIESVFYLNRGLDVAEALKCTIHIKDGQEISRKATAILYELPVPSRSPLLHPSSFSRSYLTLQIHRWDPSQGDTGDGPVMRYKIKACKLSETQQCLREDTDLYSTVIEVPAFSTDLTPVSMLKEFKPGANYSFVYLANRDGMYGTASPPLYVQIPCKQPLTGPTIHDHNYTMVALPALRTVNVTFSWQLPAADQLQCNYIYEVQVKIAGDDERVLQTIVAGTVTSYTVQLTPYTQYTVHVSYSNDAALQSPADVLYMNRTMPALPGAPHIAQIHLHNRTSARVYWTPPLFPNGVILRYQVLYEGADTEGYTVGCVVLATSCLVSRLQLHNFYNFTVRAVNSEGVGDNSTVWKYQAVLTVPGAVTTLTNTSKTSDSIFLQWLQPNNTGGVDISWYKLTCTAGDLTIQHKVPQTVLGGNVPIKYNLTGLPASTNFTCHIEALNSVGSSPVEQKLSVFTHPPAPAYPPLPLLVQEKTTDKTITIDIRAATGCRLHRVVVMETSSRSKRSTNVLSMTDIEPDECGRCCTGICYIAAQLYSTDLPQQFTVGDNKTYGGYINSPLSSGSSYKIWYGAGDEVDGVAKFKYVILSQSVVATEYIRAPSSPMSSAALVGTIVAVSVCAIVIILLLMVFIRYKRNKRFTYRTPDSQKVIELNGNGKLLTNETYQKGDALSVDSLDYSRQPNGEPVYDNVRLKHYAIMVEELRQYIELKSADDGFKKEYNHIPWGLKFSHDVAKHTDNKLKNRYGNIIAYDHSRVVLRGKNLDQDTDYINASYIDGYTTPKEYIATQGPNKFTVNDLWHMAWQERTAMIVMVTNTIELTKHKCEQYWPEEGSKQCGAIKVTLSSTKSLAHYKIRSFTMEQDDEVRNLKQFHFTAWPDHGTPTHATTLLSFLKKVRQQKAPEDGPIICHCSAGVGRSGTFIALDSLLQQAESEGKIDVYSYVTQMRKQRCNMIQTLDQYIFLHEAILEASEGFDSTVRLSDFKSEYALLTEKQSRNRSLIDQQYQKLNDILYVGRNSDASSAENQLKNRRKNVIPFNARRVLLVDSPSNYINATYIDDHRKRAALIATQHPLNNTVEDFWRMVLSQKPFALVTLCAHSATSTCTEKQELPIFWPTLECRTKEFTSVSVELLDERSVEQIPLISKQSITVHSKAEEVFQAPPAEVDHYVCQFWSSQKTLPTEMDSFVKLVAMLERRKQENGDRMIIVNCFDGARQCGLYMACHSLIQQMIMDSEVDVPETIRLIRNDQPAFISSLEQFQMCYSFISAYLDNSTQHSAVFTHL